MSDQVNDPRRVDGRRDAFVSMGGDKEAVLRHGADAEIPEQDTATSYRLAGGETIIVVRSSPTVPGPIMRVVMETVQAIVAQMDVDRTSIVPVPWGTDVEMFDQLTMNDSGWFRREQFPHRGKPMPVTDADDLVDRLHQALLAHWVLDDEPEETRQFMSTLADHGLVVTNERKSDG